MIEKAILDGEEKVKEDDYIPKEIYVDGKFHFRNAVAIVKIMKRYQNILFEVDLPKISEDVKYGYHRADSVYNLAYLLSSKPSILKFRAKGHKAEEALDKISKKLEEIAKEERN